MQYLYIRVQNCTHKTEDPVIIIDWSLKIKSKSQLRFKGLY